MVNDLLQIVRKTLVWEVSLYGNYHAINIYLYIHNCVRELPFWQMCDVIVSIGGNGYGTVGFILVLIFVLL